MGQGDVHWLRRLAARKPGRCASALLLAAAVGCGDGSRTPATDAPPPPGYWQGVTAAPQGQPWTTQQPWAAPPVTAVPSAAPPWATPYVVSPSVAVAEPPTSSVAAQPATAAAEPEPQTLVWPDSPVEPAPPVAAATPDVGFLLAPREAPAAEPAPIDVVVVDAMPTLAAPTPEMLDKLAADTRKIATESAARRRSAVADGLARPVPTTQAQAPAAAPRTIAPHTIAPHTIAPPTSDAAPTGAVVNQRAAAKIRRGHELAERGAYFAARSEFIAVLRMIAEAKDDRHGAPRRTIALADGLRALDEAADFAADGPQAASELSMSVIVASHQTPVAKELAVDALLPQQLAELYFRYAQAQLGAAVAGEPSGSMALHALGKLASLMGRVEPQNNPQADRRAFALQQAALLARGDNHLAAHELGVLFAESGHFAESLPWLRQAAVQAPHPVVFRNLARVERQLGRADLAASAERQAEFLASRGAGGHPNVQWVTANALAQAPDAMGPGATPAMAPATVPITARGPAPVQR